MWGSSPVELFDRGGGVMWPLLLMSVVALAVAAERALVFLLYTRLRFGSFVAKLEPLIRSGRLQEARQLAESETHPTAAVTATYLAQTSVSPELRGEIVGREASLSIAGLARRLHLLSAIGHLAPMLGLLGTVTGLVTAFWQIELKAGQVQASDLASGIWEALLTTVFGLCIAIPTLAVYHLLDQRLGAIEVQIRWMVAYLDEWRGQATTLAAGERSAASKKPEPSDDDVEMAVTS
ncbi:MAG: hypothetical protein DCC68_24330 [Planctomycetota bacterium]|nr:MAG: hypothetical protein DCC68_24330 [Planctomycetota bacterium]